MLQVIFYIRLCFTTRCCSICSRFRVAVRRGDWFNHPQLLSKLLKHTISLYYKERKCTRWFVVHMFNKNYFGVRGCFFIEDDKCKENFALYITNKFAECKGVSFPIKYELLKKYADSYKMKNRSNILTLSKKTQLNDKLARISKKCYICFSTCRRRNPLICSRRYSNFFLRVVPYQ